MVGIRDGIRHRGQLQTHKSLALMVCLLCLLVCALGTMAISTTAYAADAPDGYSPTGTYAVDANKSDSTQKNYQTGTNSVSGDTSTTFYKTAEWTDKDKGEGQITFHLSTTTEATSGSRVVYLLNNCTRHGFSETIATNNIKYLLQHYDTVDVVMEEWLFKDSTVARKTLTLSKDSSIIGTAEALSGADSYTTAISSSDTSTLTRFLNSIHWGFNRHFGCLEFVNDLSEYLGKYDPLAVYQSFDGFMGFGPGTDSYDSSILGSSYDSTEGYSFYNPTCGWGWLTEAAKLQSEGRWFVMTSAKIDEYSSGVSPQSITFTKDTTEKASLLNYAIVSPEAVLADRTACEQQLIDCTAAGSPYGDSVIFLPYSSLTDISDTKLYDYTVNFGTAGVETPQSTTLSIADSLDSRLEVDTSRSTSITGGSGTVKVDGQSISANISSYTSGDEVVVTVPVKLKNNVTGISTSSDGFDTTNSSAATASKTDGINGTKTQISTVDSPKLYKAPLKGTLTVSKTVTSEVGTTPPDDSFTFTLKDSAGNAVANQVYTVAGVSHTTGTDGTFSLKSGQTASFSLMIGDYSVVETAMDDYATTNTTGTGTHSGSLTVPTDGTKAVSFTNAYPTPKGTLTVSKTVTSKAGTTPPDNSFTFTLKDSAGDAVANHAYTIAGTSYTTGSDGTFTLKSGQTASFTLKAGDYSVVEAEAENYVTANTTGTGSDSGSLSVPTDGTKAVSFTNTPTTTLTGTKKWVDFSNAANTRPDSVALTLANDQGEPTTGYVPVWTNTETNEWTYTYSGLPEYTAGGQAITWSVTETPVSGYDAPAYSGTGKAENNGTITNTLANTPTTSLSLTKTWVDNSDAGSTRPTQSDFAGDLKLYKGAGTEVAATPTVTGTGNDWSVTYTGLPKFEADGTPIAYYVTETAVPGYNAPAYSGDGKAEAGGTITNTLSDTPLSAQSNVSLSKTVSGNGNANPGDLLTYTLTLKNDGEGIAKGVWVKDYAPDYTEFVSCDDMGVYGCNANTGKEYVNWYFDTLAPDESKTLTMTVKVKDCSPGTNIENTALVGVPGTPPTDPNDDPQTPVRSNNVVSTTGGNPTAAGVSATSGTSGNSTTAKTADATPLALVFAGISLSVLTLFVARKKKQHASTTSIE